MHVAIDPRKAEALRTAFDMSESSVRRTFREFPEITESPDLIPKLEYLTAVLQMTIANLNGIWYTIS